MFVSNGTADLLFKDVEADSSAVGNVPIQVVDDEDHGLTQVGLAVSFLLNFFVPHANLNPLKSVGQIQGEEQVAQRLEEVTATREEQPSI